MENPAEEKMPFTFHLDELRKRLIRILIAVGIGFVACWYLREWLFQVITAPLVRVLPQNSHMIYTSLPEAFFNYMKISFYASLFLTSPFTLYQLWKFVSPGLYPTEKKYVAPFVISSTILFIGGVLFGYYLALPPAYSFFVEFSSDFLKPMFSLKEYLSLSLKLLLAFGLSFELPVFIFFMAKIGVVNSKTLAKQRRYAILVIFIAAAVLTPSPDAVTQIIMAIPLMILYEFSIFIARFAEKKHPEADDTKEDVKKSEEET
ncbi:MAG: twin-arginine translocase subunit TatC [Deltaproteobacteria bacterium]|nr:twin-arginine translocase subunit TatC [Deltaproteobacteria bacterium]